MATGSEAAPPEPEGLQFDHAEFEQVPPSKISCAACHRPIVDQYHEINGTIVCEPCKAAIATRLRGGSGFVRFARVILFGSAAAAAGALAYIASIKISHINISLISIFVGYLIGRAVRAGSRNLGGLACQLVAVVMTYLAIGATYTAIEFDQLIQAGDPRMPDDLSSRVIDFVLCAMRRPVDLARENVIVLAIVGFALWQAWKMNVRLKLVVTGPYRVGEAGPEGATLGTTADA